MTTDANGKVKVWVLSSDVICQPRLVAKWKNDAGDMVEVGSVTCDFDKAPQLRRFGLLQFPDEEEDSGWIFDAGILSEEDEVTPAKIYLKFQKDPLILRDGKYFNADGTLRAHLDDDGNWSFVNTHLLRVRIVGVLPQEGVTIDSDLSEYATLIDEQGNPVDSLDVTSTSDGAAQFRLKAGQLIGNSSAILLEAEDLTQHTS